MNDPYLGKYLKYKAKYLKLKQSGGLTAKIGKYTYFTSTKGLELAKVNFVAGAEAPSVSYLNSKLNGLAYRIKLGDKQLELVWDFKSTWASPLKISGATTLEMLAATYDISKMVALSTLPIENQMLVSSTVNSLSSSVANSTAKLTDSVKVKAQEKEKKIMQAIQTMPRTITLNYVYDGSEQQTKHILDILNKSLAGTDKIMTLALSLNINPLGKNTYDKLLK